METSVGNQNVGWKTCAVLLMALCASEVTAHAQTLLMWDPPAGSPIRVDGYRIYEDGRLIGEAAAASLSWPINLADGQRHTFAVSAIHHDDVTNVIAEGTPTAIVFVPSPAQSSDTVPPVIAVNVEQNGDVKFQATATVADNVALHRIELSLDGVRFATCYASPCSSTVFIKPPGSHVISAAAWDRAGNTSAATTAVQR